MGRCESGSGLNGSESYDEADTNLDLIKNYNHDYTVEDHSSDNGDSHGSDYFARVCMERNLLPRCPLPLKELESC